MTSLSAYFPPLALLFLGVAVAISPYTFWQWSEGWKFKHVEPSNAALFVMRIAGGLLAVFAIIGFFMIGYFFGSPFQATN